MSETNQFTECKPQMNADKRRYALDLFGSLGQGMLANEALRNATGLTPLGFDPGLCPLHLDDNQQHAPQRTLRTQSPVLTNFAVRFEKEREMNDW